MNLSELHAIGRSFKRAFGDQVAVELLESEIKVTLSSKTVWIGRSGELTGETSGRGDTMSDLMREQIEEGIRIRDKESFERFEAWLLENSRALCDLALEALSSRGAERDAALEEVCAIYQKRLDHMKANTGPGRPKFTIEFFEARIEEIRALKSPHPDTAAARERVVKAAQAWAADRNPISSHGYAKVARELNEAVRALDALTGGPQDG